MEFVSTGGLKLPWSMKAFSSATAAEKIAILGDIRTHVKSTPDLDVDAFVSEIFRQLDLEEIRSSREQLDQKMTWDQVRDWCADGFLVGGHSHTHATLSFLSSFLLEREIDVRLDMIVEYSGNTPPHTAYN